VEIKLEEQTEISRSRIAYKHLSGFYIVVPKDMNRPPVPLACPICKLVMRDSDDARSFSDNECCSWCEMKWLEPNRPAWRSGWRPSQEQVDEEVQRRQSLPIRLPI